MSGRGSGVRSRSPGKRTHRERKEEHNPAGYGVGSAGSTSGGSAADAIRKLRGQLARSEQRAKALQLALEKQAVAYRDMEVQLAESRAQLHTLSSDHDESVAVATQAARQLKVSAAAAQKSQATMQQQAQELTATRELVDKLRAQVSASITASDARVAAVKKQYDADLKGVADDMEEVLSLLEKERDAHTAAADKLTASVGDLAAERAAHVATRQELASVKQALRDRESRATVPRDEFHRMKAELRAEKEAVSQLQRQLDAERESHEELMEQHAADIVRLTGSPGSASPSEGRHSKLVAANEHVAAHMRTLHQQAAATDKSWRDRFEESGQQWAEKLAAADRRGKEALTQQAAEHRAQLEQLSKQWQATVAAAMQDWTKRDEEKDARWQALVDKLRKEAHRKLQSAGSKLEPELAALRAQHDARFEAVMKEYNSKVAQVQTDHKTKVAQCIEEHTAAAQELKDEFEARLLRERAAQDALRKDMLAMKAEFDATEQARKATIVANTEAKARLKNIKATEQRFKDERDRAVAAADAEVAAMSQVLQNMADASKILQLQADKAVAAATGRCTTLGEEKMAVEVELATKETRMKAMVADLKQQVHTLHAELSEAQASATTSTRRATQLQTKLLATQAERDDLQSQLASNRSVVVDFMGHASTSSSPWVRRASRTMASPVPLPSPTSSQPSPQASVTEVVDGYDMPPAAASAKPSAPAAGGGVRRAVDVPTLPSPPPPPPGAPPGMTRKARGTDGHVPVGSTVVASALRDHFNP